MKGLLTKVYFDERLLLMKCQQSDVVIVDEASTKRCNKNKIKIVRTKREGENSPVVTPFKLILTQTTFSAITSMNRTLLLPNQKNFLFV